LESLDYAKPDRSPRTLKGIAQIITGAVVAFLSFIRRRIIKPACAIVAVILVLAVATYLIWVWRADRKLKDEIARLHAAGEPMSMEEVLPPRLPDSENASPDYQAAGKLIDRDQPFWKKWDEADAAQREFQPPFTADEIATMNAIVAAGQPSLEIVKRARGKTPGDWGDQFVRPYMLSKIDYMAERSLADLLKIAALAAHAAGRDGEALEHIDDMLRLEGAALKRTMTVAHRVALNIDRAASGTICEIAPDLHVGNAGVDSLVVSDLIHRLEDERALQDGRVLCWRSERISMLDAYISASDGTFGAAKRSWQEYLLKPAFLDDARLMLIHLRGIEQASSSPDWPLAERRMPTALPKAIDAHPHLYVLSSITLPSLEYTMLQDYRALADRHLSVAALAVRLYAIDHDGRLPAKLDDLVPAYLPAVPVDPFSGRPILYKSDSVRPRIYSIGEDGVDDGGVEQDPSLGRGKFGSNGDVVVNLKIQPRPVDVESN